jgi:hypothetical protein
MLGDLPHIFRASLKVIARVLSILCASVCVNLFGEIVVAERSLQRFHAGDEINFYIVRHVATPLFASCFCGTTKLETGDRCMHPDQIFADHTGKVGHIQFGNQSVKFTTRDFPYFRSIRKCSQLIVHRQNSGPSRGSLFFSGLMTGVPGGNVCIFFDVISNGINGRYDRIC